jgi:hypothetical protein
MAETGIFILIIEKGLSLLQKKISSCYKRRLLKSKKTMIGGKTGAWSRAARKNNSDV